MCPATAQNLESAGQPDLPESAIASGRIDRDYLAIAREAEVEHRVERVSVRNANDLGNRAVDEPGMFPAA
jgi:hypothetical protein